MIPTLEWLPEGVNFLDQTKLPLKETYVLATDYCAGGDRHPRHDCARRAGDWRGGGDGDGSGY